MYIYYTVQNLVICILLYVFFGNILGFSTPATTLRELLKYVNAQHTKVFSRLFNNCSITNFSQNVQVNAF